MNFIKIGSNPEYKFYPKSLPIYNALQLVKAATKAYMSRYPISFSGQRDGDKNNDAITYNAACQMILDNLEDNTYNRVLANECLYSLKF